MRILIHGYYGNTNIGDEAILESVIQLAKREYDNPELVVSSSNPEQTFEAHPDVDAVVKRKSFRSTNIFLPIEILTASDYWRELSKADELWIGGGGLIRDYSLYRFALLTFIARYFKTKVRFMGPGGSQLSISLRNQFIAKPLFENTDSVVVRDEITRQNLEKLGVKKPIKVFPDPVLTLNISSDMPERWEWIKNESHGIVSVRSPPDRDIDTESMANFIDRLVTELDFRPVFLPFQRSGSPSDIDVAKEVTSNMENDAIVIDKEVDFKTAYKIISNVDYVIGVRLHSIILSARARTPFFGFAYAPKSEAYLNLLNREIIWCDSFDIKNTVASAKRDLKNPVENTKIEKLEQKGNKMVSKTAKIKSQGSMIQSLQLLLVVLLTPLIDIPRNYIKRTLSILELWRHDKNR